jgi:hypothetical protein
MSLWELAAAVDGFNRSQGGDAADKPAPMTVARLRELNPPPTMH